MADKIDHQNLIQELQKWNDGKGVSLGEWMDCMGSFEHAIGYSAFFWPEFEFYRELILWGGRPHSDKTIDNWISTLKGDLTAVEKMINHIHPCDFFLSNRAKTVEQVLYLGQVLKEIWQAKLSRDFPDRHIIVEFTAIDPNDATDYEITFYQER